MRRISAIALACLLSIMVGRSSLAFGSDTIALISSLNGKVEIQRANQKGLQPAHLGEHLFEDDVVYTYDNSRASLFFSDGSVLTVYPKSRVTLSLRGKDKKEASSLVASLSKGVMEGIGGIFSTETKRETLTAIPGIRKKIEEEEIGVRVLYPRNSTILTPRPDFHWRTRGKTHSFMVSLTLKGMRGRLWTLNTKEMGIPYPKDQIPLERGQTYFVRVESKDDSSVSDEVYFRILDDRSAEELIRITKQMEGLQRSNPDDSTPGFILTTYYKQTGIYHMALEQLDTLEKKNPMERFILEEKAEIFAKIGFWRKWEEIKRKLNPR